MKVGTTLTIQIEGSKAKLESELIGIENNEYLLIKMPPIYTIIDASKSIYKGKTIFVRYQTRGSVFGFQSHIIDFNSNTEKTISIAYPNKIENYDLRKNKRIDCYLPAKVRIKDTTLNGNIINISKEGCLIVIDQTETEDNTKLLGIDIECEIFFQLPGVEEDLYVTALQNNLVIGGKGIQIGTKLINVDFKVEAIIHNFLAKAIG